MSRFEGWGAVRFGPGEQWIRCWIVVNPPDEKEMRKLQKMPKNRSAYDRSSPTLKGTIKFYNTKKMKKSPPFATVVDVHSAYAIYPQSNSLIDPSSLVKIEGEVINREGRGNCAFVMPEPRHPISGLETMLQFLFPTFDAFGLYGRPTRLLAETNHLKSLMFAFPKRRPGYLDIQDVIDLVKSQGSRNWSEAEWWRQLKEATARHMVFIDSGGAERSSGTARVQPETDTQSRHAHFQSEPSLSLSAQPRESYLNTPRAYEISEAEPEPTATPVTSEPPLRISTSTEPRKFLEDESPISPIDNPFRYEEEEEYAARDVYERDSLGNASQPPGRSSFGEIWGNDRDIPPEPTIPSVEAPPEFTHGARDLPQVRPRPPTQVLSNRMSHNTLALLAKPRNADENEDQQDRSPNDTGSYATPSADPRQSALYTADTAKDDTILPKEQRPPTRETEPRAPSRVERHSSQGSFVFDNSKSVRRKPVRTQSQEEASGRTRPSWRPAGRTTAPIAENRYSGAYADKEDDAADDASTVSPDYASTRASEYSKRSEKSVPRPRMGVMKTVGAEPQKDLVIGDARYTLDKPAENPLNIPTVDFGPTLTLFPTTGQPRPTDAQNEPPNQRRRSSGATNRRRSSLSLANMLGGASHSPSPSRNERRRSGQWQTGSVSPGRQVNPGITPEYYAQQGPWTNAPAPMHRMSTSMSPAPPQQRRPKSSEEWRRLSRPDSPFYPINNSYDSLPRQSPGPYPRPHSRNATRTLSYGDVSSQLSAREQEHVARVTSSPFFNMSSENRRQEVPLERNGLINAIGLRQREKQEMKDGYSNQMVQHAIAQRQQQQARSTSGQSHTGYGHASMYSLPVANRTWDALSHSNQVDESRRQSWYGQPPFQQYQQARTSSGQGHTGYGHAGHASMYSLPVANRTWDALGRGNQVDESARRQSWYGSPSSFQQWPQQSSMHTPNQSQYFYQTAAPSRNVYS